LVFVSPIAVQFPVGKGRLFSSPVFVFHVKISGKFGKGMIFDFGFSVFKQRVFKKVKRVRKEGKMLFQKGEKSKEQPTPQ
jgi:hypothetical protein